MEIEELRFVVLHLIEIMRLVPFAGMGLLAVFCLLPLVWMALIHVLVDSLRRRW